MAWWAAFSQEIWTSSRDLSAAVKAEADEPSDGDMVPLVKFGVEMGMMPGFSSDLMPRPPMLVLLMLSVGRPKPRAET